MRGGEWFGPQTAQESGFYQPIQLSGICLDFNHSNFGKSEFSHCIFDRRKAQILSKESLCIESHHLYFCGQYRLKISGSDCTCFSFNQLCDSLIIIQKKIDPFHSISKQPQKCRKQFCQNSNVDDQTKAQKTIVFQKNGYSLWKEKVYQA